MLGRLLNFDTFIAGTAIKIAYVVFLIGVLLLGLLYVGGIILLLTVGTASGDSQQAVGAYSASGVLCVSIMFLPVAVLLGRIGFESIIVLFKINENLQKLTDHMTTQPPQQR